MIDFLLVFVQFQRYFVRNKPFMVTIRTHVAPEQLPPLDPFQRSVP